MTFRGAYLGPLGEMFMFAHMRGKRVTKTARSTTYKTTLGGRVRAQVSPLVLREWDCELPFSVPADVNRFKGLATGLYGLGPFSWVPVEATVTNALSLGGSLPGPAHRSWTGTAEPAGAWRVPDLGMVRHSLAADGSTVSLADAQVHPDFPVTGAVYVTGGRVVLQVRDAAGLILKTGVKEVPAGPSPVRVAVTVTALPANAASARLVVSGATQLGLPSISWTDKACSWLPGAASNSVVVEGFDSDLMQLNPGKHMYETISFTVKELDSDA